MEKRKGSTQNNVQLCRVRFFSVIQSVGNLVQCLYDVLDEVDAGGLVILSNLEPIL